MRKMSETLNERIRDAEHEITRLQEQLAALAEEKATLLGATVLDLKSTLRLEDCERKTLAAVTTQRGRITLLEEQREAALQQEAGSRLRALEDEYETIRGRLQAQHQEWLEGLAQLAALLEHNQEDRKQVQLIHDECTFLNARFGVPWASLPATPRLSRDDISNTLETIFRQASWSLHTSNIWQEQIAAIHTEKNRVAHQEADAARRAARSQSMVRSTPTTFTPGAKA